MKKILASILGERENNALGEVTKLGFLKLEILSRNIMWSTLSENLVGRKRIGWENGIILIYFYVLAKLQALVPFSKDVDI